LTSYFETLAALAPQHEVNLETPNLILRRRVSAVSKDVRQAPASLAAIS
jgi:alpha-D-ribose 1-methylphosphonate 5-triphosphate synthase subunit PhnI